jgi:putative oxidoreductase
MSNNAILLVARIFLAIIFIFSGFGKLAGISQTAGYFASLGIPMATAAAVIVGLFELIAGLAVLVGFQTRLAAWGLAVFSVLSALIAHMNWADMMQMIQFQKNLALAGGFLALAVAGPGTLSVEGRSSP